MSWDNLMVSCAAASVTTEEVETWMAWAFFLCKTLYFWKGSGGCSMSGEEEGYCLCAGAQACSGTGATDDCQGIPATPSSQARAGTWAPIVVISFSQSN